MLCCSTPFLPDTSGVPLKVLNWGSSIRKSICLKALLSKLPDQMRALLERPYKNSSNRVADLINLEAPQLAARSPLPFQVQKCADSGRSFIDVTRWARGELRNGWDKDGQTYGRARCPVNDQIPKWTHFVKKWLWSQWRRNRNQLCLAGWIEKTQMAAVPDTALALISEIWKRTRITKPWEGTWGCGSRTPAVV